MNDKMIEVRCPNCGQRMGLHIPHDDTYICVNCKTMQVVKESICRERRITLSKDEFVDICLHPESYPEEYVASVMAALIFMPVSKWPKELQDRRKQFIKRQLIRLALTFIIFMAILALMTLIILTEG